MFRVHRIWLPFRKIFSGGSGSPTGSIPSYVSSEEGDVTNFTVAVQFSEDVVSPTSDYSSGVTIKINSLAIIIDSATRQTDHSIVYYVLNSAADANDDITWEYSDILGNIESEDDGVQLGDTTPQTVINNVGTHYWFDNDADSMHMLGIIL